MAKIAEKIKEVTNEEWAEVNEFNREIAEEFLRESPHLSPQTLKQYNSALRIFFRWVNENLRNKSILDIKSKDYLRYQNYLSNRDLSSSAIGFKRAAISSLNGYIETYYEEEYPTFRNFISKKIARPAPTPVHDKEPLTKMEFDNLIKELDVRNEWQKIAYLLFTYEAGCRKSESVQILKEVADYPLQEKPIKYKDKDGNVVDSIAKFYITHDVRCKGKGKAGEVRKLQFGDNAMNAIQKWLKVRGEDNCPYLFVTRRNGEVKRIGTGTFNNWCSGLFTHMVGRRVHPHSLRSARATNLSIEDGKDIKSIQALLGHKSSTTTEIYIVRDTDDDSLAAFV